MAVPPLPGLGTLPKLACCGFATGRERRGLAVVTCVGAGTNQHSHTNEEALTPAEILVLQHSVPCLRNHKGDTGAATGTALRSPAWALQEKKLMFSLPGHTEELCLVVLAASHNSQHRRVFLNPLS